MTRVWNWSCAVWDWLRPLFDLVQACLRGSAPLAPFAAAILALSTWWASPSLELLGLDLPVQVVGLLDLAVAWVVVALLYFMLGMTHVKRANASTYCELKSQLTELRGTYEAICEWGALEGAACEPPGSVNDRRARKQFVRYTREVEHALDGKDWGHTVWVLGMGYVSAWQMLHRAQEALVNIEPIGALIERAEYDRLRLAGSSIDGRAELGESLKAAVNLLTPLVTAADDVNALRALTQVLVATDCDLAALSTPASKGQVDGAARQLQMALAQVGRMSWPTDEKLPLYEALSTALTAVHTVATQVNGYHSVDTVLICDLEPGEAARVGASGPNGAARATAVIGAERWQADVDHARDQIRAFLVRLNKSEHQFASRAHVGSNSIDVHPTCAASHTASQLRVPRSVHEARIVVGTVRQTLNAHRDDSRAGLVRARNQLACTAVVTGLISYSVLWLAIMAEVPVDRLRAGIAFFLIGALVGLFSRLHLDFGSDTATDDFGLSTMRHLTAPLLSGVAAVLGVALVALTSNMNADSAMTVFGSAFQFPAPPIYFLSAALFGLTPGLLIDRLKQQTEQLKNNLRSTAPQRGRHQAASAAHG